MTVCERCRAKGRRRCSGYAIYGKSVGSCRNGMEWSCRVWQGCAKNCEVVVVRHGGEEICYGGGSRRKIRKYFHKSDIGAWSWNIAEKPGDAVAD